MNELIQSIRRLVIRLQLRSLTQQEQHIIAARKHALDRLTQVRRERGIKEVELWLSHPADATKRAM
jgi:hypothetical protein